MSTNTNQLFSDAEIQQMKETGATASKSFTKDTATGKAKPSKTVIDTNEGIASGGWGEAPTIARLGDKISGPAVINDAAGKPVVQHKVTKVSIDRYNKSDADRRLKALEASERQAEELAEMSPKALHDTIRAMDRKLRKLEKLVAQNNNAK